MNEKNSGLGFDLTSKFWRVFMVVVAVFLIFAGPTYVSYVLADILKADYIASIVSGITLFVVGLVLIIFLARKKILT
jgi:hypothetical protein